jgi:hypothetical protein
MNECFKNNRFLIEGAIWNPVKIHCENGDILEIKWSAHPKTKHAELNILSKYHELLVFTEGQNYRFMESMFEPHREGGFDYFKVNDQYRNCLGWIKDNKIYDPEDNLVARVKYNLIKLERTYWTPDRKEIAYSEAIELVTNRWLYFRSSVLEDDPVRLLILTEFILQMEHFGQKSRKATSFRRPGSGLSFE